tara:strand:+ start:441 stop:1586 length:1146 start_codon:yes stop_codon:yes gene_type:complete
MTLKIPFWKHSLKNIDFENVKKAISNNHITSGPISKNVEEKISKYLDSNYAVLTSSCTTALQVSLMAIGIKKNDEVITTPMSFIATSNAIILAGGTPKFVDVDPYTGLMDLKKLKKSISKKTKAIIPVHLYGQMTNIEAIKKITANRDIKIIEDSAHAFEAKMNGKSPGSFSSSSALSFYATKAITCGEGGCLVTNEKTIYEKARKIILHGMDKAPASRGSRFYSHYDMPNLGMKCNLDDVSASLLIDQTEEKWIKENLQKRWLLDSKYRENLNGIEHFGITLHPTLKKEDSPYLFTLRIPEKRDLFIRRLEEAGIGIAVNYRPIHLMEYYKKTFHYKNGDFPEAEKIGKQTLTIPSHGNLKDDEINYICQKIKKIASEVL